MRSNESLTLGLLPEKKLDWRKFLLSYAIVTFLLLCLLISRLIWPEHMSVWSKYTVTEVVPRPDLVPEKPVEKPQPKAKLLPEVKFETPKLIVPRELPKPRLEEAKIEPPKIQPANFEAPKIAVSGAAPMPRVVLTNTFGSSATPTVNAPIQKVQTGGFGDPNGLPGEGKQGAKLTAAKLGSFDLPEALEPVMALVGPRELKGQLRVPGSATEWRSQATVMAAEAARACRRRGSRTSRLQRARGITPCKTAALLHSRWRLSLSLGRLTPMRLAS